MKHTCGSCGLQLWKVQPGIYSCLGCDMMFSWPRNSRTVELYDGETELGKEW